MEQMLSRDSYGELILEHGLGALVWRAVVDEGMQVAWRVKGVFRRAMVK